MLPRRSFLAAASCLALPWSACVPNKQHEEVRGQLRAEQRKAVALARRARETGLLSDRLAKRAELAELERDEARAKLAAAERLLALKPGRTVPGSSIGAGEPVLAGSVTFAAGSDRLSAEDRKKIAEIARVLARVPGAEILVEGHSDPTPIERTQPRFRSNMQISTVRAMAVYHELVRQPGVDARRVVVVGYGEHRPGSGGATALRRVDIRYRPTR